MWYSVVHVLHVVQCSMWYSVVRTCITCGTVLYMWYSVVVHVVQYIRYIVHVVQCSVCYSVIHVVFICVCLIILGISYFPSFMSVSVSLVCFNGLFVSLHVHVHVPSCLLACLSLCLLACLFLCLSFCLPFCCVSLSIYHLINLQYQCTYSPLQEVLGSISTVVCD